jgi:hypothetical protein
MKRQTIGKLQSWRSILFVAMIVAILGSASLVGATAEHHTSQPVELLNQVNFTQPSNEIIEVANTAIFIPPTSGTVTQRFTSGHQAVDISGNAAGNYNKGRAVYAPYAGVVTAVRDDYSPCVAGAIHVVEIDHGWIAARNKYVKTLYAHMASQTTKQSYIVVSQGATVSQGTLIGYQGDAPRPACATGVHLHWMVYESDSAGTKGVAVNPEIYTGALPSTIPETVPNPNAYKGQYVNQKYQPIVMAGTSQTVEIQLKNTGTANWDANTKLVVLPRNGGSPFYDPSWIAPNRVVSAANTSPGGTNTFRFTLRAPTTPGRYKIEFAFVQEAVTWFSEPGDGHIWIEIDVRFPVGIGSSRPQMFVDAYNRNGGSAKLGFPMATVGWSGPESDAVRVTTQAFDEGGYIIHDEDQDNPINSVPAYYLGGPLLAHFQAIDGSRSKIGGGPTSDIFTNSNGQQQVNFPKGYITWNGTSASETAWPAEVKNQWHAEYHNGSNLNAGPTWVQNEAEINHQWGTNAPGNGKWGVWNDNFSTRWTGTFAFSAADYIFKADSNDEVKVWIDGQLLLDSASLKQTTRFISAGDHKLVVEYRHRSGAASLRFGWQSDTTGCTASIENGTVYTNKRTIQLRFNVPGATQMMLSNDGGFAGATWQPYQSTVNWTLSDPGNRIATLVVYSRFRDASGSQLCGSSLSDDIVYDALPPTVRVTIVELGTQDLQSSQAIAATTKVTIQLIATDQEDGSGVASMQVSTDKSFTGATWKPFSELNQLTIQPGETIYVRVRDTAGNVSNTVTATASSGNMVYLPAVKK